VDQQREKKKRAAFLTKRRKRGMNVHEGKKERKKEKRI